MTTRKAKTSKVEPTTAQLLAQLAAMQEQMNMLMAQQIETPKAKGKAAKGKAEPQTDAQKKAARIREFVDSVKDLSLAQTIKRIAPIGTANRKAKTFVNDWEAGKVPTADTLKYFPIEHRSAFKAAWKKAKKAGTISSRAEALEMLEKAM